MTWTELAEMYRDARCPRAGDVVDAGDGERIVIGVSAFGVRWRTRSCSETHWTPRPVWALAAVENGWTVVGRQGDLL